MRGSGSSGGGGLRMFEQLLLFNCNMSFRTAGQLFRDYRLIFTCFTASLLQFLTNTISQYPAPLNGSTTQQCEVSWIGLDVRIKTTVYNSAIPFIPVYFLSRPYPKRLDIAIRLSRGTASSWSRSLSLTR